MAARRLHRSSDLQRRVARRPEYRKFVIFREGEETEEQYLTALKSLDAVRGRVKIEIDPQRGSPSKLVRAAAVRASDPEVDECWCVFDVEAPAPHPDLGVALDEARRADIRVALSNPCFELWLILHFEDSHAYLTNDEARRRRRVLDGQVGKAIEPDRYMAARVEACRRARALDRRHERNGQVPPTDNPSSSMPDLLAALGDVPTLATEQGQYPQR